jgi:hypothetical protein
VPLKPVQVGRRRVEARPDLSQLRGVETHSAGGSCHRGNFVWIRVRDCPLVDVIHLRADGAEVAFMISRACCSLMLSYSG